MANKLAAIIDVAIYDGKLEFDEEEYILVDDDLKIEIV